MTVPAPDRPRSRLLATLAGLFAQLFFIAAGVYLGMQADEWRAARERREATRATLANFRAELASNREVVRDRIPYHRRLRDTLAAAFQPAPATLPALFRRIHWEGLRPMRPAHTAWDLALATQALSYVEPRLAFRIAELYQLQAALAEQTNGFAASAFGPAALAQPTPVPFMIALQLYLEDVAIYAEPRLLAGYDAVIPHIDSALARLGPPR